MPNCSMSVLSALATDRLPAAKPDECDVQREPSLALLALAAEANEAQQIKHDEAQILQSASLKANEDGRAAMMGHRCGGVRQRYRCGGVRQRRGREERLSRMPPRAVGLVYLPPPRPTTAPEILTRSQKGTAGGAVGTFRQTL